MKTHAIHWKSRVTGTVGTGTKLFEREEADHLAEELNEEFPDIDHKAVLHTPRPAVIGPPSQMDEPRGPPFSSPSEKSTSSE